MVFVDEALEQLARRRLLRQIVLRQIETLLLKVGDRLPAAGSRRLEIDVDFLHRLRSKDEKNERGGLAKMRRGWRAADSGRRSAGSFFDSEKRLSETGRGKRGLFTVDAMISLEF
jgi:hypothetical protein